jgi:exodeoxyribonuclease-3
VKGTCAFGLQRIVAHSIQSAHHESRYLERERDPRAARAIRGIWAEQQPDVICLQEIKAKLDQIPQTCSIEGYTCYWHGAGGYSGVALHIRRDFASAPEFTHPDFDLETRIVQAQIEDTVFTSVYVPNGGKDFEAKIAFINALIGYAADLRERGMKLVLCGDMNIARSEIDVHPKERKPRTIGQLPQERELFERLLIEGGLVDVGRMLYPDDENYFSWWAPWRSMKRAQHRLAPRLRARKRGAREKRCPAHRNARSARAITRRSWPRSSRRRYRLSVKWSAGVPPAEVQASRACTLSPPRSTNSCTLMVTALQKGRAGGTPLVCHQKHPRVIPSVVEGSRLAPPRATRSQTHARDDRR